MNFDTLNTSPGNNEEFERPRNRILVGLNHAASVEVFPNTADKKIYTFGVDGCTVTAVYTEYEDGTKKGTLTHFEPTFIKENLEAIPAEEQTATKVEATLFVNYDENDTFEPKEHVDRKLNSIALLKDHLKKVFNDDIPITIIPYELAQDTKEERQIDLIMRSKKEGRDSSAELRWWKGSIKL
jgi:hypothetical protein